MKHKARTYTHVLNIFWTCSEIGSSVSSFLSHSELSNKIAVQDPLWTPLPLGPLTTWVSKVDCGLVSIQHYLASEQSCRQVNDKDGEEKRSQNGPLWNTHAHIHPFRHLISICYTLPPATQVIPKPFPEFVPETIQGQLLQNTLTWVNKFMWKDITHDWLWPA